MGDESLNAKLRFDLADLGFLDGQVDREVKTLVRSAALQLHASSATFLLLDSPELSLFRRATYGVQDCGDLPKYFKYAGSLASEVIDANRTLDFANLADDEAHRNAAEIKYLNAMSYIGAPVYGPAAEPVGVLFAVNRTPNVWTKMNHSDLKEIGHLLSRHILLKATMQTLKLVSRERHLMYPLSQFKN